MFRPVVTIIRSLSFDTLNSTLFNCVAACLMTISLHQGLCFVFYDFLRLGLFCFICFLVFSWSLYSFVPCFFGLLILSKHTFMYYKAVRPHTSYRHTVLKQRPWCRDVVIKQANTQLYKVLLSVSNDKDLMMVTTGRNM